MNRNSRKLIFAAAAMACLIFRNDERLLGMRLQDKIEEGISLMESGDLFEATFMFQNIIENDADDPESVEALFYLGKIYFKSQAYEKCVSVFSRFLEKSSDETKVHEAARLAAKSLYLMKKYEAAAIQFESTLSVKKMDAGIPLETYKMWADSHFKTENYQEAEKIYRAIYEKMLLEDSENPDILPIRFKLADCCRNEGELDQAFIHYEDIYYLAEEDELRNRASLGKAKILIKIQTRKGKKQRSDYAVSTDILESLIQKTGYPEIQSDALITLIELQWMLDSPADAFTLTKKLFENFPPQDLPPSFLKRFHEEFDQYIRNLFDHDNMLLILKYLDEFHSFETLSFQLNPWCFDVLRNLLETRRYEMASQLLKEFRNYNAAEDERQSLNLYSSLLSCARNKCDELTELQKMQLKNPPRNTLIWALPLVYVCDIKPELPDFDEIKELNEEQDYIIERVMKTADKAFIDEDWNYAVLLNEWLLNSGLISLDDEETQDIYLQLSIAYLELDFPENSRFLLFEEATAAGLANDAATEQWRIYFRTFKNTDDRNGSSDKAQNLDERWFADILKWNEEYENFMERWKREWGEINTFYETKEDSEEKE